LKQKIINHIQGIKEDLFSLSTALYNNTPKMIQTINLLLEKQGFQVIKNQYNNLVISQASIQDGKQPKIGLFFNYSVSDKPFDKWNVSVSTPMSIGAALGLASVIKEIGGSVIVFGVPWGREDLLSENKLLKDITAAIMLKAGDNSYESGYSINFHHIIIDFKSKSFHSTILSNKGSNALHGVIQSFNGIFLLNQYLPSSIKIEGIITNGGNYLEIPPLSASAEFYVYYSQKNDLEGIITKVENCAKGAALQTGTEVSIVHNSNKYNGFITNKSLNRLFCHNLKEAGIIDIQGPEDSNIPLMMGNISHKIPTIFPCVGIQNISPQEDMEIRLKGELSAEIEKTILLGSQAAALTGYDVITNKNLSKEIKQEFKGDR
jgi:metal-dependent amidase/aminoacylase/carboxypeptidase family protein